MLIKVASIGIELEGGINRDDLEKIKEKYNATERLAIGRDGSVYVSGKDIKDAEIKFWSESVQELLNFVKFVFNNNFKQNSSCGNHMHFKFNDTYTAVALFSFKKFYKMFIREYIKKFNNNEKYLNRLKNNYCKASYKENIIIQQLINKQKCSARYTAINLNSYNVHQTMEIRILPHFDSYTEAKDSILFVVNTVQKILNSLYEKNNILIVSKNIKINKYQFDFNNIIIVKKYDINKLLDKNN
ncbi:MAG: hypothetical protein QXL14_00480 [Candidatus Aenigmatarchaeota archaeon]